MNGAGGSLPAVLIVGGAGYIGSHVCKALASEGFLPVTYDDLRGGHRAAVRWGPLENGALAEADRVAAVLDRWQPVGAILLAGYAYVGESMAEPAKYYRNNIADAIAFLESWRVGGGGPIIFSSSCAVYGTPDNIPIGEGCEPRPINPYGRSKRMLELILQDYGAAYGQQWMALRYFNAAGADPDGEIGEDHDPEPHLIPRAILAALGRIPALEVYGNDYPTPDGTAIRDYIHVSDIARGHVQALHYLLGGGASRPLNLGTGRGISVKQIVGEVELFGGRPVPHSYGPRRSGDPPELVADPLEAGRLIGFAPRHSSLETVVATAWRWLSRDAG